MKRITVFLTLLLTVFFISLPVSAYTSTTNGNYYLTFIYESVPFLVHAGGKMTLQYSNYTNPWPGYYQVTSNDLYSVIYNYFTEFPNTTYPFALGPGIIDINRYDNDVLNLTITDFSSYSYFEDSHNVSEAGINYTNSYLSKDPGSQYDFVGRIGYASEALPWYYEKSLTKSFIFN